MANSTVFINESPVTIENSEWTACEGILSGYAADALVNISVRMPFEERMIIQKWRIKSYGGSSDFGAFIDGPYFRSCDEDRNPHSSACGWGLSLPIDRLNFSAEVIPMSQCDGSASRSSCVRVGLVIDKLTSASAATSLFYSADCNSDEQLWMSTRGKGTGFSISGQCSASEYSVFQVVAVASTRDEALSMITKIATPEAAERLFDDSCADFNERWREAFKPNNGHFSGHLPLVQSNDASLDRLYYWAALALVSLERTSLKSFPRQFVISEGASNSYDGSSGMGGSGQFVWDLSFTGSALSLLEPEGTRSVLTHIVANANFSSDPIGVPQAWDAYPEQPSRVGAGQYCFDFVAAFIFVQCYSTLTDDTAFLTTPVRNNHNPSEAYTPLEFLRRLAWHWTAYPRSFESDFLVDYGSDKRNFLEAAASYTNVIAALQMSNAGMMLSLSRILEKLHDSDPNRPYEEEILNLRETAARIVEDSLRFQYVPIGGYWQCLNSSSDAAVPVMALADTVYVSLGLDLLGQSMDSSISAQVRAEMISFFLSDLLANGWVRAISLADPTMKNINCTGEECSEDDLVSMRSDWSATGAYGGLAGAAVDAIVGLEGGFSVAMDVLRNISLIARADIGSMPAQGVAVMSPPYMVEYLNNNDGIPPPKFPFAPNFPEFFDEAEQQSGFPAVWPSTSRSIQNAEGSIVDAFIRSVFGWRPDWAAAQAFQKDGNITAAIESCLYLPHESRGHYEGTLLNVRTPFDGAQIDISASAQGLSWRLSESA